MSEIKVPEMGESIMEGTISKWHVKEGDQVNQGDVLAELETDKVNIEISAEESGIIAQLLSKEGETVQVGETIAHIGSGAGAVSAPQQQRLWRPRQHLHLWPSLSRPLFKLAHLLKRLATVASTYAASPAARKLARERGIDLGRKYKHWIRSVVFVRKTSKRIFKNRLQLQVHLRRLRRSPQPAAPAADPGKPAERRKMSRRRITIANRLVEAQQTAAMLTTFNEVDMTAILDIRKRRKKAFQEKHEVGLGFMSFFTKAVIGALKAFPLLNAEIQGDEIVVKQYYDIGIAVSAKEGLVVPVVRDADRLSFAQIEKQIADLAGKARSNTLGSELIFKAVHSRSRMAAYSAPCFPRRSLMHRKSVFSACTKSSFVLWRSTDEHGEPPDDVHRAFLRPPYRRRLGSGAFPRDSKELLEDPEALLLEG